MPVAPPAEEWQGGVHLAIDASSGTQGKSQISHRNNPAVTGDADGFGFGYDVLTPFLQTFQLNYSWMADNLGSPGITGAVKLGFITTEYPGPNMSPRTGEDAWDKLLIYEPSNGNGGSADGAWHSEAVNFTTGKWWIVDRAAGISTSQGSPMPLSDMASSGVMIGGRPVSAIWALLTDADPGEEAILTSIQFGIGSNNPGGSVYLNQIESTFYRKGMVTTFGFDPSASTVICVPTAFDAECEVVEATIQDALDIENLGAEDIIMVDSGIYAENPTVSTGVTLMGAGAGTSGCGRVGPETTMTGLMTVSAPDVEIDGFSFTGAGLKLLADGAPTDRLQVRGNRFLGGAADQLTIAPGGAGSDITLADNEFVGDGGVPLRSALIVGQANFQGNSPGAYVVRNCFSDAVIPSIALETATVSPSGARSPVISDNTFGNTAGGINSVFGTLSNTEISGNTFTAQSGPAIEGRMTSSLVLDNLFQGGTSDGVALSASVDGSTANTAVLLNCFYQNAGTAVSFATTGSENTNYARFNDVVGNGTGAQYGGAQTINVTSNYWGATDGPSGDGSGSGDAVDGAGLAFAPFQPTPATYSTPCNPVADLAVSKVDDIPYATATSGDPVVYTITVENLGPFDATGVLVSDTPPDGLFDCTWTCQATGGAACGAATGAGIIAETITLPVGDTVTYEMACTFIPGVGTGGKLTNSVTVTPGGQLDGLLGNNSASESTEIPEIFDDGFESGNTSAWSATVN